ncbi:MAG: preprotein translocase subunit YajC [Deltaproteobacteria bacterium]|nr:preprotein translocase subunit YajC [Deltaproteobacteria bacterium]MBI3077952.1 preprotein translocase subunit YajC [Deltaproteobacteria bacterium]
MLGIAFAMGGNGGAGGGAAAFQGLIPLALMFVIFYVLLIRPQQKKAKEHREFLNNLKKGEWVVTSGGIHGRITGLTDTVVTLEIAEKVRVKVSRTQIAGSSRAQELES